MQQRARVLIAEGSPATRLGLRIMLSSAATVDVVGETDSALSTIEHASSSRPDVILLDTRLLGDRPNAVLDGIRGRSPRAKLVFLVDHGTNGDGHLPAGAEGYISKDAGEDEIISAVSSVFAGQSVISADCARPLLREYEARERELVKLKFGLSAQEVEMLRELSSGATNEQIATRLYVSEITVIRRIQHVVDKLGVANKTQAVAEAIRNAII